MYQIVRATHLAEEGGHLVVGLDAGHALGVLGPLHQLLATVVVAVTGGRRRGITRCDCLCCDCL